MVENTDQAKQFSSVRWKKNKWLHTEIIQKSQRLHGADIDVSKWDLKQKYSCKQLNKLKHNRVLIARGRKTYCVRNADWPDFKDWGIPRGR